MTSKKTILIVDDDIDTLSTMKDTLEMLGFGVIGTDRAEKALDILNTRALKPCLIICDYIMPNMDGIEFSKLARSDYPELRNTPIIILTAAVAGRLPGLVENSSLLAKPVNLQLLIDNVESHCLTSE